MKKFLLGTFSTVLLTAFVNAGTLSKKNSEKTDSYQLCGVIVTYFDSSGQPYDQKWFTSDQPTLADCQSYQAGVIQDLQKQGYRVQVGQAAAEPNDSPN
ncbi:hypothetical protein KRE43_05550 [Elizabethkingia meningoseptica]|uniref:hypothetical protein n=1 Tax=Elizabethkingia meningoseptica TaxID=238 RepID=UPI0023B169AC|nr:hypothetical protein [Elizabethkingia meningoseptica]MDE5525888.1 hypothetical protein [Elizabethkingia meningoseptica]MDE5529418.1 hypothetical protein [Elizabethkingia meningoseptica]MDE5532974.1 hypothetical protein [Elizabethkingia meningoseptica]MDE5541307.1 hypothetical protein [Elizabethkingia meningoseptica]